MRGHFTLDEIEPEAVCDPAVGALARQIRVHVEPSWTERLVPAELSIQTRDGRALTQRVQVVPGGPAAPLGAAAVQRKIEDCFLGGPSPLPRPAFATLQQRLAGLEQLDDIAQLFRGVV